MSHLTKIQEMKLKEALRLAQLGLRVFPLWGKLPPRGFHWKEEATTDPIIIQRWWGNEYKGANIGIATGQESGIIVIDVDVKDGSPGVESLYALIAKHGELPKTWRAVSASGGYHFYFEYPGWHVKSCASTEKRPIPELGIGIDIRGDGGLIVAPPSYNAKYKKEYQWVEGHAPWETELAKLPESWAKLLKLISEDKGAKVALPAGITFAQTAAGMAGDPNEEQVTWEKIYNYPLQTEPKFSSGWLKFQCPVHGGDGGYSFSVCTDEEYYGYYRCHNCGVNGYIVGTKGWQRWQAWKKKKGLNDISSLYQYYANESIAQDTKIDDLDLDKIMEMYAPPTASGGDSPEQESWEECLRSVKEIERANAYLRAYAESFAKQRPDEGDLFEPLAEVEKHINRAKKLKSVKMLQRWRPELVAVYATIQMVFDEEMKRLEEERKKREHEEWKVFLTGVYVAQNGRGEPLTGALACWTSRCIDVVLPGVYDVIPSVLRANAKACQKGEITEEAFANALKAELDTRLNQQYGDYVLVKYNQLNKDYYEVICTNETKKRKPKKTNNLPTAATRKTLRRYFEEITEANADLKHLAEKYREQYPELFGKLLQIESALSFEIVPPEGVGFVDGELKGKRLEELSTLIDALLDVYEEIKSVFSEPKPSGQNREWEVFFESLRHVFRQRNMRVKDIITYCSAVSPTGDERLGFPYPKYVMPKELRDALEQRRNSKEREKLETVFAAVLDDKLHQQYGEKKWSLIKDEQGRYRVVSMVSAEDMA